MTKTAYMTIDDSPSDYTDQLCDFLLQQEIPAIFYCIGGEYNDAGRLAYGMAQRIDPIVRAIKKGFAIGNHLYTHRRSSELPLEEVIEEIEKTEALVEEAYKRAGKTRSHKLIRFPHLDNGCGGWIVDYRKLGPHKDTVHHVFSAGLNIDDYMPSDDLFEKKAKLNEYLIREGYSTDVFRGVTFPWYTETEMARSPASLITFSSSDWMLNTDITEIDHDALQNGE